MKKQLLFLFLCVSMTLTGWAQSISFTSALTTAQVGSTVTVNYQYTIPANGFIYCAIELLNDWSWVSNVAIAQLDPAPAGTNVTGSFDLTIPNGTLPTSSLLSPQNYKIKIELKNSSYVWVAGAYPGTQIDITPMPGVPTVSQLSGDGTNTITHGCESSAISILGTNFTGATAVTVGGTPLASYTVVSSTRIDGILPTGSHVGPVVVTTSDGSGTSAGNFTVAVPGTTNTTTITSFETYTWPHNGMTYTTSGIKTGNTADCVTELLDLTITTAAPAITFTSIPTSTPAGTDLTVNYQYTVPADGYIYCGLELHDSNGYVSGVASAQLNPAPSGTNATGSLNLAIPSGTTPTANLTGTFFYKIKIELKSLPGYDYLAGDFPSTPVNISAPAPSISFTSIPTTTVAGTDLTVNYQYTIPANGYIYCALELQNTDTWALASTVASAQLDPAPAGTNVSGTFNLSIPNGTIPSTSLSGQTYRIKIELKDSSYSYLADAFPSTPVIITTQYTYYADGDGDGYGAGSVVSLTSPTAPSGYSVNDDDCDDSNATVYPNATEIYDIIDNDCDGSVDEGAALPSSLTFCKGATVAFAKGTTDLTLYTSTSVTAVALSGTTALSSKLYFATLNGSARTAVSVTVNPLPDTVASLTTSDAVLCKHIGTSNEVTYTAAPGASSYNWTVPANVTIVGGAGTNALTVNFSSSLLANIVGSLGSIGVKAVDGNGCISATAKTIALTTKLPTAPTSLTLTSGDTTDHFSMKIPLSDPVAYFTSLSDLTSGIKKVGPYMGTETVFTLTAPEAPTAASYEWTLPSGVNLSGVGNGRIITVDFADVAPGIVSLPIVVKSVGGCGLSSARTLNLLRALPTAPTKLVLTDGITETAITKVGPYTGKSTVLTLTATPFTTQGGTATSYAWKLPPGVVCTSTHTTGATLTGSTVIETVLTPWTITDAIATATSTITIDFSGAATAGVLTFPLSVYAVNGTGNSKARTLTVTAAAPATPSIVGSGGTGTPTQFSSCATKTYTATLIPGATYNWTVPGNAPFTGGTGNVIVVDYSGTTVGLGLAVAVTCSATNGTGTSGVKSLTVKRIAGGCRLAPEASATDEFSVIAYPNPSSSEFTIDVQSSSKGTTGVQVYDMAGRLIENRQAKSNSVEVGRNYASGIYNVIVNKGAKVKTLRVIKK
jgi:hypothetical protein